MSNNSLDAVPDETLGCFFNKAKFCPTDNYVNYISEEDSNRLHEQTEVYLMYSQHNSGMQMHMGNSKSRG
jgi:hypothetical protein